LTVCAGQEQGHPTAFPNIESMTQQPPPEPRARELARRYGVWVLVLVAFIAGIIFYFRYQSTLAPMLGGGK
jgi:hypothetical protein